MRVLDSSGQSRRQSPWPLSVERHATARRRHDGPQHVPAPIPEPYWPHGT
jgi:hypothetical protein